MRLNHSPIAFTVLAFSLAAVLRAHRVEATAAARGRAGAGGTSTGGRGGIGGGRAGSGGARRVLRPAPHGVGRCGRRRWGGGWRLRKRRRCRRGRGWRIHRLGDARARKVARARAEARRPACGGGGSSGEGGAGGRGRLHTGGSRRRDGCGRHEARRLSLPSKRYRDHARGRRHRRNGGRCPWVPARSPTR